MIRFVTFKWNTPGYRSRFESAYVNTLRSMLERNCSIPHEVVCITDDPRGLDARIRHEPLWSTFADLPSPHGHGNPSCYRRLPLYDRATALRYVGERFVIIDIDVVITREVDPLFDIDDDFKIWGDTARGTPYNGSLTLMNAGARQRVWDEFDPVESPKRSRALGYIGSDQGWIGACLGIGEKKWSRADGVYSYRNEIAPNRGLLPRGARLVIFHGRVDPWQPTTQARHRWVKEHYR